jgi:hypothetical protein
MNLVEKILPTMRRKNIRIYPLFAVVVTVMITRMTPELGVLAAFVVVEDIPVQRQQHRPARMASSSHERDGTPPPTAWSSAHQHLFRSTPAAVFRSSSSTTSRLHSSSSSSSGENNNDGGGDNDGVDVRNWSVERKWNTDGRRAPISTRSSIDDNDLTNNEMIPTSDGLPKVFDYSLELLSVLVSLVFVATVLFWGDRFVVVLSPPTMPSLATMQKQRVVIDPEALLKEEFARLPTSVTFQEDQ